ncbi:alkaline phosphatase, partial [Staphylococcus equorum]|nr:alkaline phosphatase [Staphylococcus equorum]
LTLTQITESAIAFLSKDAKKGFFLMVEGGQIDWACHGNDAATTFREVQDMDNAIKVAYEFYKKHPKETLIVVTADHETGGIALGTGRYE